MKLILLLSVFAAFAAVGYRIYLGYRKRKQFFESLLAFCQNLTVEINFSKNTVRLIIDTYIDGYCPHFATVLRGYSQLIDAKTDITRPQIDALMWNGLKTPEKTAIADFFHELGRHSVDEECQKIETKRTQFAAFYENASNALKREASIYLKICILLGIAAVILLL